MYWKALNTVGGSSYIGINSIFLCNSRQMLFGVSKYFYWTFSWRFYCCKDKYEHETFLKRFRKKSLSSFRKIVLVKLFKLSTYILVIKCSRIRFESYVNSSIWFVCDISVLFRQIGVGQLKAMFQHCFHRQFNFV